MDTLLVLPLLVPLAGAVLSLLAPRALRFQRVVAVLVGVGVLAAGLVLLSAVWRDGVRVTAFGDWPAPFGIVFAADLLGASLVAVTGLMALAIALFTRGEDATARERVGHWPLSHALVLGVVGAFLTGDLFNLYVWFEVMLMASFALAALGAERDQLEGAVKYLVLSLLSSTLFLSAVGLLYGATGSLNMAALSLAVPTLADGGLRDAIALLLFAAFGLKAAVFPLFFWLPASYHTPPTGVSALFAGLLTKVGVYALVRTFTLIFPFTPGSTVGVTLSVVAGATMLVGVLGAAAQGHVRRVLSFHIVSQIGYMVMGLALATPLALAGAVFYLVHHIVTKTNLFLVAGVIRRLRGTEELARLGGLYAARPWLALLFLVPAMSLAGVPPLSGFWAKLVVLKAGLDAGAFVLVAIAVVVGLLTLYSMTKILAEAFWKDAPADVVPLPEAEAAVAERDARRMLVPVAVLAVVTVGLGLGAGPVAALAERAGAELADPSGYVRAVLGAEATR